MLEHLFRKKTLADLHTELAEHHGLKRALGPTSLTALGVGAIIGAGIFAMTGRVAAEDAGPAIMISFVIAGIACLFAALCYSEFASMAPVAGSAYTYTYATLGEIWAWIIGWDLILEYAMSCGVVAAHWSHYLEEFLHLAFGYTIPPQLMSDPFTPMIVDGQPVQAWLNLPAVLIMMAVTGVLILGVRESAFTNAVLVAVKTGVVLFVVVVGWQYVSYSNWTSVPVEQRRASDVREYLQRHPDIAKQFPHESIGSFTTGSEILARHPDIAEKLPVEQRVAIESQSSEAKKWGMLSVLGVRDWLAPIDSWSRSSFMPFGISGIMVGAAIVFFSYIGFDAISTHAEEAIEPQRTVPIGILASLVICTILYMLVAGVITGMEPYPDIDTGAAVAAAFRKQAETTQSPLLSGAALLISVGALAGMTSVLLVTFQAQARIFLAMARDGLLPAKIFAAIHERFQTPHRSTLVTGIAICFAAGLLPIRMLEEMVSIGTLMAFVMVCASVWMLRYIRPDAERPFRCPVIWLVAPGGMLFSLSMMLFLPVDTWLRLVIWLAIGLVVYFIYGFWNSRLRSVPPAATSN